MHNDYKEMQSGYKDLVKAMKGDQDTALSKLDAIYKVYRLFVLTPLSLFVRHRRESCQLTLWRN